VKIIVAPDSFKGSCSAAAAAAAIGRGARGALPGAEVVEVPVADGGEGTVEAMVKAMGGYTVRRAVTGPLGKPVDAFFGRCGETAVVEMAAASGLTLVPPDRRDPRLTNTFGTGELIRAAVDAGARHIIVGLGGSATNDGGAGMAQALGARLLDADGRDLPPGGAALARLDRLDLSGLADLTGVRITVACDVDNPLTGPRGASAVFGPQKGATPQVVAELDQALARWAEKLEEALPSVRGLAEMPGAGAAGGLAAGLVALCGAELRRGIDLVLETVGFAGLLAGADLVITGEGRIDAQTLSGKVPYGVAQAAARAGVPTVALCGGLGPGYEVLHQHGIAALFTIVPGPMRLAEAMSKGEELLEQAAGEVARLWVLGRERWR
jgi:glycerate 2-kinase